MLEWPNRGAGILDGVLASLIPAAAADAAPAVPEDYPPAPPDLRAPPGEIRFCWPKTAEWSGYEVEAVLRRYGVRTFSRAWPDSWFRIGVSAGQITWVKHIMTEMGVPWLCGDGTSNQSPQAATTRRMPIARAKPVKAGWFYWLLRAIVGEPPAAAKIHPTPKRR